jgi:hypothetical protein
LESGTNISDHSDSLILIINKGKTCPYASHEGVWGSEGIALIILKLSASCCDLFPPGEGLTPPRRVKVNGAFRCTRSSVELKSTRFLRMFYVSFT